MDMAQEKQISQSSLSPSERIKMALTEMASFRRGTFDKTTFSLYSKRLMQENVEDVVTALQQIQELPREDFESAIPAMPDIIALVKAAGVARVNRETASQRTTLVGHKCRQCRLTSSGYVADNDRATRYCRRCGEPMHEVYRERVA